MVDPRDFVLGFMERELGRSGVGIATGRAELRLCRAVLLLERGQQREALDEANAAAAADPAMRGKALLVARMCIKREIEAIRAALAPGQDGV